MLPQIFPACIDTDNKPVRVVCRQGMHKATITGSQVQYGAVVVFKLVFESIKVHVKGRSAPDCFHLKPPICRMNKERQIGVGRTAGA